MKTVYVTKVCKTCSKEFETTAQRLKHRSVDYCSRECYYSKPKLYVSLECAWCGKMYSIPRAWAKKGGKYCSIGCKSKDMCGESNTWWKDGRSLEPDYIYTYYRETAEYRRWKRNVLKKYGKQCMICGSLDKIHVHHIYSYYKHPDKQCDIDNGIPLCHSCHMSMGYVGDNAIPYLLMLISSSETNTSDTHSVKIESELAGDCKSESCEALAVCV